jgi:hydrogenase maturation protease
MKILVLGLGNDLLADDAAGILAARRLQEVFPPGGAGRSEHGSGLAQVPPPTVDVVESSLSGVALLDLFLGYDKAIIVDAVQTGRAPPGTIHELAPEDLGSIVAPSPHYTGLPELLELAKNLDLPFPGEIAIFALEVQDPHTIGGALSAPVEAALPDLTARVIAKVRGWS